MSRHFHPETLEGHPPTPAEPCQACKRQEQEDFNQEVRGLEVLWNPDDTPSAPDGMLGRAVMIIQEVRKALAAGTKHYNKDGKLLETDLEILTCLLEEGGVTYETGTKSQNNPARSYLSHDDCTQPVYEVKPGN